MENHQVIEVVLNAIEDNVNILNVIPAVLDLAMPLQQPNLFFNIRRDGPPRNENYFEETIPLYNFDDFKSHFRMSPQTMEVLIQEVGRALQGHEHIVPLQKKVHFVVWMLSKPETFLAAGDRFSFSKSTAHLIYTEIVSAVSGIVNDHITWPNPAKQLETSQVFQLRSHGFPGIIGVMDSTHIEIKQPVDNAHDYYNRNKYHSVNLLAVCDENCKFINVATGFPGRLHDARVYRVSDLAQALANDHHQLVSSDEHHLLADCAYPLMPYIMTPFQDNGHLNYIQTNYNRKLSSVRSTIERAFGRLKCKFRRLNLLELTTPNLITTTIIATCIVHNIIIQNDGLSDDEYENDEDEQPDVHEHQHINIQANLKRNAICSGITLSMYYIIY